MIKKLLPAVAIAALVLSLTACGSSGGSTASCTPTKSGSASEKVTVSGKSTKTTAKFPKNLTTKKTERTQVTGGSGRASAKNDTVTVDYVAYNGTTGKKLAAVNETKAGTGFPLNSGLLPGLYKALLCTTKGSRVVAVIPPADAFGTAGSTQLGIKPKDSIVFVLDVLGIKAAPKSTPTPTPSVSALPKANGTPQSLPAGYPTVTLASNGAPTITVPKTPAPTTLEIADLQKGSGAVVADGDSVTVHYTGVIWDTNTVFDSSWTDNQPATFTTDGVIPGFGKAIVGQTVGSQVMAIIPPADGYGSAGSPPAIKGTDTLVFVIDILADSK